MYCSGLERPDSSNPFEADEMKISEAELVVGVRHDADLGHLRLVYQCGNASVFSLFIIVSMHPAKRRKSSLVPVYRDIF